MSSNSNLGSIDSHNNSNEDTHHRIDNTFVGQTIDLNGHNLSVESVITEGSSQSSFSTSVELNDLPEELLTIILDSLDFQSTLLAERVCKRWQQLINGLFDNTRVLYITDENKLQLQQTNYKLYAINEYNNVRYISLKQFSNCGHDSRALLSPIISRFSGLKAFILSVIDMKCDNNMLSLLCDNCDSDLTHISLMCFNLKISVSSDEVLSMSDKFVSLRILQISSFNLSINETCLKVIIEKMRKLEVLILDGFDINTISEFLNTPITGEFYSKISPNISRLELPGFMLNESAVINLVKQELPKFNALRISCFDQLNAIKLICDRFQTLTSIDIALYSVCALDIILFMNSVSKLPKLTHLNVSIDSDVNEHDLSYQSFICFKYSHTIISLEITSAILSSNCVLAISRFMPQLVELRLICIRFIGNSDECVQPIKHMNQLKRLTLLANPQLTDSSVMEIIDFCTNLEYFNISWCEDITKITIISAINRVMKAPNKTFKLCVNSRFRDLEKTVIEKLGKNILKFV